MDVIMCIELFHEIIKNEKICNMSAAQCFPNFSSRDTIIRIFATQQPVFLHTV